MSWNTSASEFVPGKFSFAPKPQPQATPTPQPNPAVVAKPQPVVAKPQPVATPIPDSWEKGVDDDGDGDGDDQPVQQVTTQVAAVSIKEKKKEEPVVAVTLDLGADDEYQPEEEEKTPSQFVDDPREHINLVFIGHVDAGKSTLSGHLLYATGMVDQRTIEKYEKEAKEKNRGTWFLAYIMDTNEEERAKGKTVEVGRAHFSTEKKRYTILDAPGHKNYVPNMIMGVSQADIGILVISARKGEFEAGFDRDGQTREHAILAKTLGIKKLVVAVNKLDDPTVQWSKERYDEIEGKLSPFLKQIGYNPKDVVWVPISGYDGSNIIKKAPEKTCPWYKGESLIQTLDNLVTLDRLNEAPLRVPVLDKYKESGKTYIIGKVESGVLNMGDTIVISPSKQQLTVIQILNDDGPLKSARPGENVKVVVKGSQVEEDAIYRGAVISHVDKQPTVTNDFVAQIAILQLLEHKSLFSAGYECVVHIHTSAEEVVVKMLLDELDPKNGASKKKLPKFVQNKALVIAHMSTTKPVVIETFEAFPQLGRFTLRDEGKTIAFGKILATRAPIKKKKENH